MGNLNRNIIIAFLIGVLAVACNKKDASAPVIVLIGKNIDTVDLHGTYIEKGATADDTQDGDLTALVVISGAVDTSLAGFYTINYSVADKAGNKGLAKRSVMVRHTAKTTAGNYSVLDPCVSAFYNESITADTTAKLKSSGFGNFQDAVVDLQLSGKTNSIISIPQQTVLCGLPPGLRIFKGEGIISPNGKEITITYTVTSTSSYICKGTYTK